MWHVECVLWPGYMISELCAATILQVIWWGWVRFKPDSSKPSVVWRIYGAFAGDNTFDYFFSTMWSAMRYAKMSGATVKRMIGTFLQLTTHLSSYSISVHLHWMWQTLWIELNGFYIPDLIPGWIGALTLLHNTHILMWTLVVPLTLILWQSGRVRLCHPTCGIQKCGQGAKKKTKTKQNKNKKKNKKKKQKQKRNIITIKMGSTIQIWSVKIVETWLVFTFFYILGQLIY